MSRGESGGREGAPAEPGRPRRRRPTATSGRAAGEGTRRAAACGAPGAERKG